MKPLIFDAGPLINFSMNGLLDVLTKLKERFNGEFLITKEVKREIIDTPLTIKKYELEGIRLEKLFNQGIIKHADITDKQVEELRVIRENLLQIANNTYKSNSRYIHILDKGEAAAFALSIILKKYKNIDSYLVIDERTARVLCENPENLRKLLEKKFNTKIKANLSNYKEFEQFKIIRSTELAYIAYKNNLIPIKDSRTLEAMLYALKYHGCSISEEEIKEMINMVR
ncbi:hypothetical protein J4221_07030 [Candidatus Pacearchaeota archaeon]|nr:hypothetical protein [Candidatus Pacearchaeota archaeon]